MATFNIDFQANGLSNLTNAINSLEQKLGEVGKKSKVNVDTGNSTKNVKSASDSITGLNTRLRDLTKMYNNLSAAERESDKTKKYLIPTIQRLSMAVGQNRGNILAAEGSYAQAQQRLTALGFAIRNASGGFNNMTPAIRAQITEYRRLNAELTRFDKGMGLNFRSLGKAASGLLGSIPILGQFTTAAGLALVAYQALQKSFSTNLKLDALEYSMGQVAGNATKFAVTMDYLRDASNRLGLDFVSTVESFKQWEGAARYSNLTAEESRKIFDSVANAGARLKLSNDQVQGTFLALSQMMSKGVVSMEELRRQLGDRIPGAFQLAAKAMGITEAELNKLVASGKLASEDFLPKFAAQLDKSFGNNQVEKIQSLQASVNRLSTEFDLLFRSERVTKFFVKVTDGFALMAKQINAMVNSRSWKELGAVAFTGGQEGLDKNAALVREREMGQLDAVGKSTYGYAKKESQERIAIINAQKKLLDLRVKEFQVDPTNSKLKEELVYASAVYAEMIKINSELGLYDKRTGGLIIPDKKTGRRNTTDFSGNIQEIARRGAFSSSIEATEGLDTIISRTREEYRKLNKAVDDAEKQGLEINKKNEAARLKIRSEAILARESLAKSEASKITQQTTEYEQDTENIIARETEKAGVLRESSRAKDLQNSKNYYAELKRTHESNAAVTSKIEEFSRSDRAQINAKWDNKALADVGKLQEKIKKVEERPFARNATNDQIQKELDKRLKQINDFYDQIEKILGGNNIKGIPRIMATFMRFASLGNTQQAGSERQSELGFFVKNSLRRSVGSLLEDAFDGFRNIGQSTYDVEKKYSDLRRDASAEQIQSLERMRKLERQINNGLTGVFTSLASSFGSIGSRILTTAVGDSVAKGDLSSLTNLFKGDNKLLGYGALGSLAGSLISGAVAPTNVGGKIAGGLLSGAGTGLAVGAAIGGPLAPFTAAIGGLVGALGGLFGANRARKQEELERQQYEEQKRTNALLERQNQLAYTANIIGQQTSQGLVTGVDRNAEGQLVARVNGKDLIFVLEQAKNAR